jgi:Zn-finger nucleic acid-binding protein
MRCARCLDVHLITEEFQGQIIDACPRCHGVWLPRNDFDQLIARRGPPQRGAPAYDQRHAPGPAYDERQYGSSHDSSGRLRVPGRRRSWLSELFD